MAFDFAALIDALTTLTKAVKEGTKATEKAAPAPAAAPGITAPSAGPLRDRLARLRGGGLGSAVPQIRGAVGGALGRLPLGGALGLAGGAALGAGAAALGVAANAAGQGIIAASRGGDFGSAVARSLNNTVAAIPFLGEYTGAAALRRTLEGTEGDLNAATGQVARILGPGGVDDRTRSFLAQRFANEQVNLELDRQANNNATNLISPLAQARLGALAIDGSNVAHLLQAAGVQQNQ